ncbi:hypothetical protein V6N12_024212 [Hibiscus sabdariffa]|uniref:Uncharacterized protein n=1 Tax=Hibiscus sabdariffa TaxID=183260 RepID=A0ABR2FZX5_9ROSI
MRNKSLTEEFVLARGIRKGDMLFPNLIRAWDYARVPISPNSSVGAGVVVREATDQVSKPGAALLTEEHVSVTDSVYGHTQVSIPSSVEFPHDGGSFLVSMMEPRLTSGVVPSHGIVLEGSGEVQPANSLRSGHEFDLEGLWLEMVLLPKQYNLHDAKFIPQRLVVDYVQLLSADFMNDQEVASNPNASTPMDKWKCPL